MTRSDNAQGRVREDWAGYWERKGRLAKVYPQTDDQIIICKESEVAYFPSPRVKLTKGSLVCGLSNRRVGRQVRWRKELSHHTFRTEWTSLTEMDKLHWEGSLSLATREQWKTGKQRRYNREFGRIRENHDKTWLPLWRGRQSGDWVLELVLK